MTDVYHSCYDRYHYRDDYCDNATGNRLLGYTVQHSGLELFPIFHV